MSPGRRVGRALLTVAALVVLTVALVALSRVLQWVSLQQILTLAY